MRGSLLKGPTCNLMHAPHSAKGTWHWNKFLSTSLHLRFKGCSGRFLYKANIVRFYRRYLACHLWVEVGVHPNNYCHFEVPFPHFHSDSSAPKNYITWATRCQGWDEIIGLASHQISNQRQKPCAKSRLSTKHTQIFLTVDDIFLPKQIICKKSCDFAGMFFLPKEKYHFVFWRQFYE